MGKRQISAREVIQDIRNRFTDEDLKKKYGMDQGSLESLFTKLREAGFLTQAELDKRSCRFDLIMDIPRGQRPQRTSVPLSARRGRSNPNYGSRPPLVSWAVRLIYLILAIGIFNTALMTPSFYSKGLLGFVVFVWLFIFGWLWFLANRIGAGKNWARIVWLLNILISVPLALLTGADSQTFLHNLGASLAVRQVNFFTGLVGNLLALVATVMLFRKPSREWYAKMKTGTSPSSAGSDVRQPTREPEFEVVDGDGESQAKVHIQCTNCGLERDVDRRKFSTRTGTIKVKCPNCREVLPVFLGN
jgi:hypothetical protein